MSFLDSVLSSLQTGKPSQAPLSQPPAPPVSSSMTRKDDRKSGTAVPNGNVSGGTKRKAEDQLPRPPRPATQVAAKPSGSRPITPSGTSKTITQPASAAGAKPVSSKPVAKNGAVATSKPAPSKAAPSKTAPAKPASATPAVQSRPPPKGSYAEIMARAKALQEQAPANLGTFRHQAVSKERLSKVERKRRMQEAILKEKEARRLGKKTGSPTAKGKAAVKTAEPDVPAYKGTAKPSKVSEEPAYRGTAGKPASRGANESRANVKRRVDEYLGTDEEDEGDYGGYNDYYSEESSDMEAGFDDVEEEEGAALKSARKEDEEELRMEMAAKQAKLERQKKLAALAARSKR